MGLPVFKGVLSTSIWKAFALNALLGTLILVLSMFTKSLLEDAGLAGWIVLIVTIVVTFAVYYLGYTIMWVLFAFGGSMLVDDPNKKKKKKKKKETTQMKNQPSMSVI